MRHHVPVLAPWSRALVSRCASASAPSSSVVAGVLKLASYPRVLNGVCRQLRRRHVDEIVEVAECGMDGVRRLRCAHASVDQERVGSTFHEVKERSERPPNHRFGIRQCRGRTIHAGGVWVLPITEQGSVSLTDIVDEGNVSPIIEVEAQRKVHWVI